MNKHIKAHIFSIAACLMINAGLFAGGPYILSQVFDKINNSFLTWDQTQAMIAHIDFILSEKVGTKDEGYISQTELDKILKFTDNLLSDRDTLFTKQPKEEFGFSQLVMPATTLHSTRQIINILKNLNTTNEQYNQAIMATQLVLLEKIIRASISRAIIVDKIDEDKITPREFRIICKAFGIRFRKK